MSNIQQEIVDKLAYFAVFKHPLRASEIQNLLHNYYEISHVLAALATLQNLRVCHEFDGHFSLLQTIETDLKSRFKNEKQAAVFIAKIPFYVRLMSAFPYVRGIAISGSLSKGVMHEDGDIDYFIITAENRLWFARMMLILFKKVFLLNSHRYFCVNYLVSENHPEIPDENLFTATEIATLLPVYNPEKLAQFKKANAWVSRYYGHFEHPITFEDFPSSTHRFKRFLEWCLNNAFGNLLDIVFMYLTVWRWDVKFKHFSRSKFNLTLRSTRNVSKHHPRDFQTRVLKKVSTYQEKVAKNLTAKS